MEYLTNIPESSKNYGINKLLTVRHLTIDWKHRDTELHLRSPELYDEIMDMIDFRELLKVRSNQLRLIHHLSRSIFHDKKPDNLFCINLHRNITLIREYSSRVYIDFSLLLNNNDSIETYKSALRGKNTKVIMFSSFIPEDAMIKFCIKHNLPIAHSYRTLTYKEIYEECKTNIITILAFYETFTKKELLYFWLLNIHTLVTDEKQATNPVGFKTNIKIKDKHGRQRTGSN